MAFQGFGVDHNVLIMEGPAKNGGRRTLRFWAERGLIHCENSADNEYKSMSVRQFLLQVKANNQMLLNSPISEDTGADRHFRELTLRYNEKAQIIAAIAQEQGMPSDASARRAKVRERAKTIAVTDRRGIM